MINTSIFVFLCILFEYLITIYDNDKYKENIMNEILYKKLKLEKFKKIILLNKAKETSPFDDLNLENNNVKDNDLIISYVYTLQEFMDVIVHCDRNRSLKINGVIYFLYPKVKNKLNHTPIGRDSIFPFLSVDEDTGYVEGFDFKFNSMMALDDNYTLIGVKYIPKENLKKSNKSSMCVNDYIDKVVDVIAFLKKYPNELAFFEKLSIGYQKDWARYIYSAKTDETVNKRKLEMVEILKAGYKTKQLYREENKHEKR